MPVKYQGHSLMGPGIISIVIHFCGIMGIEVTSPHGIWLFQLNVVAFVICRQIYCKYLVEHHMPNLDAVCTSGVLMPTHDFIPLMSPVEKVQRTPLQHNNDIYSWTIPTIEETIKVLKGFFWCFNILSEHLLQFAQKNKVLWVSKMWNQKMKLVEVISRLGSICGKGIKHCRYICFIQNWEKTWR